MAKAKLFKLGGSQAVRLPKVYRFSGTGVVVEKRRTEVVLRPVPRRKLRTLADAARYMASLGPDEFPDRDQPKGQARDLTFQSMAWHLDTNVCIDVLRGRSRGG